MTTPIDGLHWYALHVRSNHEKAVSHYLKSLGVTEFFPFFEKPSKRGNGLSPVQLPLFPGYVFAHFDWRSGPRMYGIPGVVRVLGIGTDPTPVDANEIETIQKIVSSPLSRLPWPYLSAGQRVLLIDGPLRGLEGVFLQENKRARLIVSVSLLHRSLAVPVEREWVEPIRSARGNVA
jgi:transcription antitermination factor NusG